MAFVSVVLLQTRNFICKTVDNNPRVTLEFAVELQYSWSPSLQHLTYATKKSDTVM